MIGLVLVLAGLRFVLLRRFITFATPVCATAVFVAIITRIDLADAGSFVVTGIVVATIAGFGPVWSRLRGMRSQSVLAAAVLAVLLYFLVLELLPGFRSAPVRSSAAIAGPPPRRLGLQSSVAADHDRLDALH